MVRNGCSAHGPACCVWGLVLFSSALRREESRTVDCLPGNDNDQFSSSEPSAPSAADRFRATGVWLVLAGAIIAIVMAVTLRVRVDPHGTTAFNLLVATLLLVSRMWWDRKGHRRVADAFGTVAVAGLGGMVCGAVAMPNSGCTFRSWTAHCESSTWRWASTDCHNRLATEAGDWLFALMRPAYNFTLQMFFVSMVVLALLGDRVEAWRGAFCFVGTLLTTCS